MPDIIMKREHTDRWTKMRLSRARSSGPEASSHMLSSVDCITTTSASEFSVHTPIIATPIPFGLQSSLRADMIFGKDRRECTERAALTCFKQNYGLIGVAAGYPARYIRSAGTPPPRTPTFFLFKSP